MNVTREIMNIMHSGIDTVQHNTPETHANQNKWTSHAFYSWAHDYRIQKLFPGFQGLCGKLAEDWFSVIPYWDRPINYLEIGGLHGAFTLSICRSYAYSPQSTITVIDPYTQDTEYGEYINEEESNYNAFMYNIARAGVQHKVRLIRDYSWNAIPKLPNNTFDLVYIDGNHQCKNVLEDAVLVWRRVACNGWIVFNAYEFPQNTSNGIMAFVNTYTAEIKTHFYLLDQYFVQKI